LRPDGFVSENVGFVLSLFYFQGTHRHFSPKKAAFG
jgi:hypothetical protein